jgi:hypothetical protein
LTEQLGPIHFLAIEFPDGVLPPDVLQPLVAQLQAGSVFLLDLEFARRRDDGSLELLPATAPELRELTLSALAGEDAGLLDSDDLELLAQDIAVGSLVAVLVYEDRTMTATIDAAEQAGGQVVAGGSVDMASLEALLDEADPALARG